MATLIASAFVDQRRQYINDTPIRPILSPPIPGLPIWPVCLRLSVVCFLPTEEGDFVHPSYVSPGGEGFNTPLQVNM